MWSIAVGTSFNRVGTPTPRSCTDRAMDAYKASSPYVDGSRLTVRQKPSTASAATIQRMLVRPRRSSTVMRVGRDDASRRGIVEVHVQPILVVVQTRRAKRQRLAC